LTTLLITSNDYLAHDMGAGHPEQPARLQAILERLEARTWPGVRRQAPAPAPLPALEANHEAGYLGAIRRFSESGQSHAVTPDTSVGPGTWDCAVLAAGGVLQAVDAVFDGEADNALCLHRPPGHHAEAAMAMGFCFVNHVAVAARHLRQRGVERVAIVDWDVHHGNGTQNSFYDDGSVFFTSLHEYPLYPGTGAAEEQVRPALEAFAPDFLLLSAGFDAHARDPLAGMQLSEAGFASMTEQACRWAQDLCDGRLVSLLEGGYDLASLAASVEVHLEVLQG
jgi:acetoin utilization deacetylase AcuC-like enzyme